MNIVGDLPIWAMVLLGLFAAAILVVLNLGWLLAAQAMLAGYGHKGGPAPHDPRAERNERARSPR